MIQILYLDFIIHDLDLYTMTLELFVFDLIRLYHCIVMIIRSNLFHYDLIVYFCHVFMIFILFLRFKLLNKRAIQHSRFVRVLYKVGLPRQTNTRGISTVKIVKFALVMVDMRR